MASPRRNSRVASLIQSELGQILVREIADPQLQGISITDVQVTSDLSLATIFYHPGFGQLKEIERGIQRAMPFLRRTLGRALNLRIVPELKFEVDTHTENLTRLLGLIDEAVGDPTAGTAG